MADKRNPKDTDVLVEELLPGIIESIIDDATSVSVEQAEKELTEAGFDVVDGRADAELFQFGRRSTLNGKARPFTGKSFYVACRHPLRQPSRRLAAARTSRRATGSRCCRPRPR